LPDYPRKACPQLFKRFLKEFTDEGRKKFRYAVKVRIESNGNVCIKYKKTSNPQNEVKIVCEQSSVPDFLKFELDEAKRQKKIYVSLSKEQQRVWSDLFGKSWNAIRLLEDKDTFFDTYDAPQQSDCIFNLLNKSLLSLDYVSRNIKIEKEIEEIKEKLSQVDQELEHEQNLEQRSQLGAIGRTYSLDLEQAQNIAKRRDSILKELVLLDATLDLLIRKTRATLMHCKLEELPEDLDPLADLHLPIIDKF
jgi:hypothetical protein